MSSAYQKTIPVEAGTSQQTRSGVHSLVGGGGPHEPRSPQETPGGRGIVGRLWPGADGALAECVLRKELVTLSKDNSAGVQDAFQGVCFGGCSPVQSWVTGTSTGTRSWDGPLSCSPVSPGEPVGKAEV